MGKSQGTSCLCSEDDKSRLTWLPKISYLEHTNMQSEERLCSKTFIFFSFFSFPLLFSFLLFLFFSFFFLTFFLSFFLLLFLSLLSAVQHSGYIYGSSCAFSSSYHSQMHLQLLITFLLLPPPVDHQLNCS